MTEPTDQPEPTEDIDTAGLTNQLDKLLPYKREIMIVLFIILILLVVFLGYAFGGLRVCTDLDGLLDDKFKCHPNYFNQTPPIYNGTGFKLNFENGNTQQG